MSDLFSPSWTAVQGVIVTSLMILGNGPLIIFTATLAYSLGTFPCWEQEKVQYLAITKGSFIPLSEIDSSHFLSLAKDFAENNTGNVEIRKPIFKDIKSHCRNFSVDGGRRNQRLIRRIFDGFLSVPELLSITSFWPEIRICKTATIPDDDSFMYDLQAFVPECTHAMLLCTGDLERKYPILVSNLDSLKGKRKLIETLYNNYMARLRLPYDDHQLQLLEVQVLKNENKEVKTHKSFSHHAKHLNIALVMDMYLTSGAAESAFMFAVSPGDRIIHFMCHKLTSPDNPQSFLNHFLLSLMASAEPFLKTDFPEHFDVYQALLSSISSGKSFFEPSLESLTLHSDQTCAFEVSFLRNDNLCRLLYIYLSLASGPFFSFISSLRVESSLEVVKLQFAVAHGREAGIVNFLSRIAFVLIGGNSISISVSGKDGLLIPRKYDSGMVLSLAQVIREKYRIHAAYIPISVTDHKESLLELLFLYGMVKCRLDQEHSRSIENKDRVSLGLPPVNFSGFSHMRLKKKKLKTARKAVATSNDEQSNSSDSLASSSEEEGQSSGHSLRDQYEHYARLALKAQINTTVMEKRMKVLSEQCRDCQVLLTKQRHLMIFELFLKIKKLLSLSTPSDSSVSRELGKKGSKLNAKLRNIPIPGLAGAIQRSIGILETERVSIAKPLYHGEPLFWVKSDALRTAFIHLLPYYQPGAPAVPESESINDVEPFEIPKEILIRDVLEMKKKHESLENNFRQIESSYSALREKSEDCVEARKKQEILLVGTVFHAFIEDLKKLAPNCDILDEAQNSSSEVRAKMEAVGITSFGMLKKVFSFVLAHRNTVAHPTVVSLPRDQVTLGIEKTLRVDFELLRTNYDVLQQYLP